MKASFFNNIKKKYPKGNPLLYSNKVSPPEKEIKKLIELFQNNQFCYAEQLAISITNQFPNHSFTRKLLGVVLKHLGKMDEALENMQKSVKLEPNDSETNHNLAITLTEVGRFKEAVSYYAKVIALNPQCAEAYNNLGFTLYKIGRFGEAEFSYNQAIMISPSFAEAHYNLGITLVEMNKLEDALLIYRKAISLNPHYAEANFNLGNVLNQLGRFEEAEASYEKAISLKVDFSEAYFNLGKMLMDLKRTEDAIIKYKKAIKFNPNLEEAHCNLGYALFGLGRLKESEKSYKDALELNPCYVEALWNLSINFNYMNLLEEEINILNKILLIDPNNTGLRAGVSLAICNFLKGNFLKSKNYLFSSNKIHNKKSSDLKSDKIYQKYLTKIFKIRRNDFFSDYNQKTKDILYVIGESHSLSSHYLSVNHLGRDFFCMSKLIKGCKQWHLGCEINNEYKYQFEVLFKSLPKASEVLLMFGEIDCRIDAGIVEHKNKYPNKNLNNIIISTIDNYLNYVLEVNSEYGHNIIIQGVPCPNIDTKLYSEEAIFQLTYSVKTLNKQLKKKSKQLGFGFLDLYELTDRGDGLSNKKWHMDNYHLSSQGFLEAWKVMNRLKN